MAWVGVTAISEFAKQASASQGTVVGAEPVTDAQRMMWRTIESLWQQASATQRLTDELYCQIVKHTHLNGNKSVVARQACIRPQLPHARSRTPRPRLAPRSIVRIARASALAGWQLLTVMLGVLVPSSVLALYLSEYIQQRGPDGYASHCYWLLRRALYTVEKRHRCVETGDDVVGARAPFYRALPPCAFI